VPTNIKWTTELTAMMLMTGQVRCGETVLVGHSASGEASHSLRQLRTYDTVPSRLDRLL
jgi:hypothetical protein